jgi:hypothetical protein
MHKSWLSFLSSRQFCHDPHVFCLEAFKPKSFSINADKKFYTTSPFLFLQLPAGCVMEDCAKFQYLGE